MQSQYWKVTRYHTDKCDPRPKQAGISIITVDGSDLNSVIAYKTRNGSLKVFQTREIKGNTISGFISLRDMIDNINSVKLISFPKTGPGSHRHECMRLAILKGRKVYGFYNAEHLLRDQHKMENS